MANYWYWSWNRRLEAAVLPALKKIYQVYARQVVPALESGRRQGVERAESSNPKTMRHPHVDSTAVMRGLREEATAEQVDFTQALAVYTRATCEALYLEATRFLVRLYRREIAFVGQEARVFLEKGLNLRQVVGFQAYERLRSAARNHGYVPKPSLEELRGRQRGWMYPAALSTPADVKRLYEDLCSFLHHVVEALHQ